MTLEEKIELAKVDLILEIGKFTIITINAHSSIKKALLKTFSGRYFIVENKSVKNELIIEDVSWMINSVLNKKKKKQYHYKEGFNRRRTYNK